jgi:hypothetical protein
MKDTVPENAPGTEVPEQTTGEERSDERRPLRRPDPDRVLQGDEEADHELQRAREDVAQGARQDRAANPEQQRVDGMAERGERARPPIQP